MKSALFSLSLLFLFAASARATTVVPPTFPELVAEAEAIVRARVISVESRWVEIPGVRGPALRSPAGEARAIKTFVTLDVTRQLKGVAPGTIVLELLGGEVGDEGMRVDGMPQFVVGRVEILFISGNGIRISPLVGMMHGRYRVEREPGTGREFVARDDHRPLRSLSDVAASIGDGRRPNTAADGRPARGMDASEFERSIADEVARHAAK